MSATRMFLAILIAAGLSTVACGDGEGDDPGGGSSIEACRAHCARTRSLCTGLDQDWEDACVANCQEYNLIGRGCGACVEEARTCDAASACSC